MNENMKVMHPELASFFQTHAVSTSEHKVAAHAQIAAALRIAHAGQRHMMLLEHGLAEAMTAPHDHAIDHNLNSLRARIRSTTDAYTAMGRAQQDVAAKLVELEDAFSKSTLGLNGLGFATPDDASDPATGAGAAPPVV